MRSPLVRRAARLEIDSRHNLFFDCATVGGSRGSSGRNLPEPKGYLDIYLDGDRAAALPGRSAPLANGFDCFLIQSEAERADDT